MKILAKAARITIPPSGNNHSFIVLKFTTEETYDSGLCSPQQIESTVGYIIEDINTCSDDDLLKYRQLEIGKFYYVSVVGNIIMPDGKKLNKVHIHL